jgi:hypothetical protein
MKSFFLLWKQSWIKWIESQPFSNYKDPNPKSTESACIEEYAFGNAIYHFIAKDSSSIVLNDNLISKYINKIERNSTKIGHRRAEEKIEVDHDSKNLHDLVNDEYLSDTTSNMMGSFAEVTGFTNDMNSSITIDKFFDCLFHFSNQNYDIAYEWYLKNF